LDHVTVPKVALPDGFKAIQKDLVVSGLCNKCSQ
jgi:Fur family transcriptional regulator, ferric uptake regulator